MDKGIRVGAIREADENTVYMYGYGKYLGDEESPMGFPNPKIQLENGKVIWGYQCWWGSEKEVKNMIGNRKVIMIDTEEN